MIHSTAIVDRNAKLGADVDVGAYTTIGPGVEIAAKVHVMSHVVIEGNTTIGTGSVIYPFACIGTQTQDLKYAGAKTFVTIGERTTLREYVTVHSSTIEGETTKVGNDCSILAYCHIAHECKVGNGVIMSNCSQLAGHVIVEDDVGMGGMVGVHQFVRIGKMAFVGGFTRIAQDVPPFFIVEGNPAVARGLNTVGMKRRNIDAEVRERLKDCYRMICRENLSTSQAIEKIRKDLAPCPEIDYLIRFIESSERGITR